MPPTMTCGISTDFSVLSPTRGQVAHVLLTRLPLGTRLPCGKRALARLACVRHAASVNPEPGSNSPSKDRDPGPSPESHGLYRVFPTLQLSRCCFTSSATPQLGSRNGIRRGRAERSPRRPLDRGAWTLRLEA